MLTDIKKIIYTYYGDMMKLLYNNKSIDLYECNTFFSRLRGFMFCKKIDKALLFNKCNSIHTFFMYSDIDVIMCDRDNKVLYYYRNLKKNRVILPKKNVYRVLETPPCYFDIKVGDKIVIK